MRAARPRRPPCPRPPPRTLAAYLKNRAFATSPRDPASAAYISYFLALVGARDEGEEEVLAGLLPPLLLLLLRVACCCRCRFLSCMLLQSAMASSLMKAELEPNLHLLEKLVAGFLLWCYY